MDKYTYKEKDKAIEIERGGFSPLINFSDVHIMCKYYRSLGLKRNQTARKIYDMCKVHNREFEHTKLKTTVDGILNKVYDKKKDIIQVDSINIYQEELDFINGLKVKYNAKKLLFAFLCFKKIEYETTNGTTNMNYYSERDYKTNNLKEMFGVRTDIDMMIHELSKHGLMENAYNTDTRLLFMDMIGECKEVAFVIDRFDTIDLYFDRYNNKCKVIECAICGKLVKVKSKTYPPKYCDICAKFIKNEQNKSYYKNNLGKV